MAESVDEQLEVADVYAAALFELASAADSIGAVRSELEELVRLAEIEPGFAAFLSSSAVDDDDRTASLEKMFRGQLSDLVLDTLQVMNQHERTHLLAPLLRCYEVRQEHAAGEVQVVASSAVELDAAQKAEIETLAADLSGRRPLVRYVVDPNVIGGLVLQIGEYRFDYSIRRHLRVARGQLLDRSERGLEIGVE